jgi:hypothetical protein
MSTLVLSTGRGKGRHVAREVLLQRLAHLVKAGYNALAAHDQIPVDVSHHGVEDA